MVLNCYENREIISMVNKMALPTDFYLSYAFPPENTIVTDADKVVVTRYTEAQPCMAPYTDPCGPGAVLKRPDTAANLSEFAPPTIKLDETITACESEDRRIDPKSGAFINNHRDRMEAAVAEKGATMRKSILERLRFTAAQVLHSGGYTIEGDGVKTEILDFKRDDRLLMDLVAGGGDTWDLATTNPLDLFEAISEVMMCYGISGMIDVIMSPTAWRWYQKHEELDRRDFNYAGDRSLNAFTGLEAFNYAQPKGTDGTFRFWVVNQMICTGYDGKGEAQMAPMIPDGSIIMLQREAFAGQRVYGGIRRASGEVVAEPVWFRDFIDEKCDVRTLQAWSRPLLIPGNVNASACIQVVDPALDIVDICPVCP